MANTYADSARSLLLFFETGQKRFCKRQELLAFELESDQTQEPAEQVREALLLIGC